MKFGRYAPEDHETVPLVPLIDIVFLTLVFFMATTVYSTMEAEVGTLAKLKSRKIGPWPNRMPLALLPSAG